MFNSRSLTVVLVAAVLAILALVRSPVAVFACSCVMLEPGMAEANADVVFVGRVVAVDDRQDPITFAFAVEETRKGLPLPQHEVRSARDSAGCGAGFAVGQRWLVYATGGPGERLESNLCSGNELLGEAPPEPAGEPGEAQRGGALPMAVGGVALLGLIGLLGFAAARRRLS